MERAFTDKAGMTLAVSASLLAPAVADAAIVHVSDRPISVAFISNSPYRATVAWDVDGDGTAEFFLTQANWTTQIPGRTFYNGILALTSGGPVNGRGIVASSVRRPNYRDQSVLPLGRSSLLGPTLANGYWGGPGVTYRRLLEFNYRDIDVPPRNFGLYYGLLDPENDNLIGFAFDPGDGLHYGWARLTLTADFIDSADTIHEWAYEDEPGKSIHVGSIPAPPAALSALTLLGLGAAGVRRLRRQRQDGTAAV